MNKKSIFLALSVVLTWPLFFFAGFALQNDFREPKKIKEVAIKSASQIIINNLDASTSALIAYESGDVFTMKNTLTSQIRADLKSLEALLPYAEESVSSDIRQTINKASAYLAH